MPEPTATRHRRQATASRTTRTSTPAVVVPCVMRPALTAARRRRQIANTPSASGTLPCRRRLRWRSAAVNCPPASSALSPRCAPRRSIGPTCCGRSSTRSAKTDTYGQGPIDVSSIPVCICPAATHAIWVRSSWRSTVPPASIRRSWRSSRPKRRRSSRPVGRLASTSSIATAQSAASKPSR